MNLALPRKQGESRVEVASRGNGAPLLYSPYFDLALNNLRYTEIYYILLTSSLIFSKIYQSYNENA